MSLNSKKSWHPSKVINQAKVDKLEQDQEEQRRLAEVRREEIAKEQELARLKDRARGSAKPSIPSKISWIYSREESIDRVKSENEPKKPNLIQEPPVNRKPVKRALKPETETISRAKLNAADPFAQLANKQKKQPTRSDSRVHKRPKK